MRSGIITEAEVRRRLAPYHDRIYWCVSRAFQLWLEKVKPLYTLPDPSFCAYAIQQFMVEQARMVFGDVHGVEILNREKSEERENSRFFLQFGANGSDAIVGQWKKLDPDLNTRNNRTPAARAFNAHASLEIVPLGSRITFGYQCDPSYSTLLSVAVVCLGEYLPNWWYQLEVAEKGAEMTSSNPLQPARVRIKKQLDLDLPLPKDPRKSKE